MKINIMLMIPGLFLVLFLTGPFCSAGDKVKAEKNPFFYIPSSDLDRLEELKDIELLEKIEGLKESVFDLRSKLFLLSEATFKNKIISSGLDIVQENNLSHLFRGETVTYLLDNENIFTGNFVEEEMDSELNIYEGLLTPGVHQIKVLINFTGRGRGIYSYLNDYVFTIKSKKKFNVMEGKRTRIVVSFNDTGGITRNIQFRPEVNYEIKYKDIDNSILREKVNIIAD